MKVRHVILTIALMLLGIPVLQLAQESPPRISTPDLARRQTAIGLLRTINTAEVTYRVKNGSFGTWQALLSSQPEFFTKFLAKNNGGKADLHFGDGPEILPGWNLRLNVHADGQGYDVLLSDMTDEKCGYAALTNEVGIIPQSKAIDCEI
jgi:hypothetical protein